MVVFLAFATSAAAQAEKNRQETGGKKHSDNPKHQLGARQHKLRQEGLKAKLAGQASGRVARVAGGQYVELEQTRHDRIFVVLAEFGDTINQAIGGAPGPRRNEIREPDRSTDNVTIWQADYNSDHYREMYFNKMLEYYRTQSSGRYAFSGSVSEWVRVGFNEARYGTNNCGGIVCSSVWALVRDAANTWVNTRLAAGATLDEIKAELQRFDRWDRYDHDGDGTFDEPDGYLDHFQIVHAGEGEETGGGAQGADAIWSHRWYVNTNLIGIVGPPGAVFGGTQIGGNGATATGFWIGDYTMQPENGGLGVFAHEYAHDLGLPDVYDTGIGLNSTAFWTIMSQGSYTGDGTVDLGSRPIDFSAWEKFQLGWLNYDVAFAGKHSSHRLGPAETNTKAAQGLFVVLPDRAREVVLADPPEGNLAWWSGKGDNLDHSMHRIVAVPASGATLTAPLWFDIENGWDYAYVSVSSDGGATWTNVAGNVTTNDNPHGQNEGNGITGTSAGWVAALFDFSPWAGQTIVLRLRYRTDPTVQGKGLLADAIRLGSFTEGAENGAGGWTLDGFRTTSGIEVTFHFNAYVAEYRQYRTYDTGLQTGPYNFGFLDVRPNWVEHYPYQDGLLISYWDESYTDNNTSEHPGEGLILPVDAHPQPLIRSHDNRPWFALIQAYDSTFGLEPTDPITLHRLSVPTSHPALPAVPVFDDRLDWWQPDVTWLPSVWAGVNVPKTGTAIQVVNVNTQENFMQVHVTPDR
jgi:immune inhibitor A